MENLEKLHPFQGRHKQIGDNQWGEIQDKYYYRITNKTKRQLFLDKTGKQYAIDPITKDSANAKVYRGNFLNSGELDLQKLIQENQISFEPLEIEPEINYRISNRTARRIGIQNIGKQYDKKWGDLVIPPFGTRLVNSEMLKWYKFVEWKRQDLIELEREDKATRGPGSWATLWNWIKLLPGLALVALAGFGIPLWVVYYFGDGGNLIQSFVTGKMDQQGLVLGLGRLFQVGFICVASILPALFYYLFGRQHVEKLRQRFFHDILVLDPHLYTLSEAETKYETLLSSAYGSSSSSSPLAILLLMFSTAILVAGWILTLAPYNPLPQTALSLVDDFFVIKASPFTLGFLGIYFFSINMVFRRYVRADLTPKTYANITVRMLVTFVLVWSISALPEFSTSVMKDAFLPLAFIIGVFPEDGFRVIRDSARKVIKGLKIGGDEKYPLTDLEGLNQYDRARLLEEGIENIENLAHHNLVELLAYTRIPTARLVDMFDQSILYLHLGIFDQKTEDESTENQGTTKNETASSNGKKENNNGKEENRQEYLEGRQLLKYLRSLGVRTATDLAKLLKSLKDPENSMVIEDKSLVHRLHVINATLSDDEWLSYINNWRRESSEEAVIKASFVDDPYHFYPTESLKTNGSSDEKMVNKPSSHSNRKLKEPHK